MSQTDAIYRLNPDHEEYIWSSTARVALSVQDLRAMDQQGIDVSHFDCLLVFPPGSYIQVIQEGFVHNPASNTHEFAKAQVCVEELCRFHSFGKKPSVIKDHIAKCSLRMQVVPQPDALARLFALQLGTLRATRASQQQ